MKLFLLHCVLLVLFVAGAMPSVLAQSRVGPAADSSSNDNSAAQGTPAPAKTVAPNLLPAQNYAVLDLGGCSGAYGRTLLAMDDDINAAYGTVANEGDPPPDLTVKTFSYGSLSAPVVHPGTVTDAGTEKVYTFLNLTPTGKVVGRVNTHVNEGSSYLGTHGLFDASELTAPSPYLEEFYPQDFNSVGFYGPSHSNSEITAFSASNGSYYFSTNALVQPDGSKFFFPPHYASVLNTGSKTVFFDQTIPASMVDSDSVKFVRGTNTVAYEQNNTGMALLGGKGLAPVNFWDGQKIVASVGNGRGCSSLNDQGWMLTFNSTTAGDADGGVYHSDAETKFSAMLAGGPWEHQLTQVRPLRLSNQDATSGVMHALTELMDNGRQEFVVWDGAPSVTPWTPASTAPLVWRPRRVQLPAGLALADSAPVAISRSGVVAAIADPEGNTGPTAHQDALLLLPVDYQELAPNTGLDKVNSPPWLMVPENGNNFVNAITPASPTLPLSFTVLPDTSHATCAPASTTSSPKVLTVGGVKKDDGSYVQVGCAPIAGSGAALRVSVKPYKYKYVMLHEIVQNDGVHGDVSPQTCPDASDLQEYLNKVYGLQTNTYFYVGYQFHRLNYDANCNGTLDVDTGGSPDTYSEYKKYIQQFSVGLYYNVFYVKNFTLYVNGIKSSSPGTVLGRAFFEAEDAIVEDNSNYSPYVPSTNTSLETIAHELGHLFGLSHADSQRNYIAGGLNPACLESDVKVRERLMYSKRVLAPEISERLIMQEWNIINP